MSNRREQEIIDLIECAENGFGHYKSSFLKLESIYHAVMDSELRKALMDAEKSNLYFNKGQTKSRRISDSLVKAYFGNDKFASIGVEDENPEIIKIAEAIEKEVKLQLSQKSFYNAVIRGLYKAPFLGTPVTRSYFANNKIIVEDVSLQNIKFDPSATSQEDTRYLVHDIFLAIEDIKRMQRSGVFSRSIKIEELITEDNLHSYTRIKLQEVYTRSGDIWKVSTVYDGTYFFRKDKELQDGQPFSWGGLLPQLEKFDEENFIVNYYEPVIAAISELQDEYNIKRNQIIDAVKQSLNPKLIVPSSMNINPMDLKKPIGFIPATGDPRAIQVIPSADYRGGFQDISLIDQEMSEISGVSAMMNGVSIQKNKTATQTGVEHSEGSLKLEIYTRNLNETYFEHLLTRVSMLCWKYSDSTNFLGTDRSIDPKLKITFNTGLGVTNDYVKAELLDKSFMKLQSLFQMQMNIQDLDGAKTTVEGAKELTRESLTLSGIKNADEYVGKKKELGDINEMSQIENQNQIMNGEMI